MSDEIQSKLAAGDADALLELERSDSRQAEGIWHGLSREERLRAVLASPAESRQRLITLAVDSRDLVRRLPVDEFARTVMALGQDEAGQLVADSTDEQLAYILDLTSWVKERFAPARYEAWLPLIMDAGPARIKRWLTGSDMEVLTLAFAHWIRVVKYLPSQEQQEPPDDLPEFTLDGVYFIEFRQPKNAGFIGQIMVVLKSELPALYTSILEATLWESAAQLADYALRWRKGRLADLGFPDRLEGLELWAKAAAGEAAWQDMLPKSELDFLAGAPPRSDCDLGLLPPGELLPAVAGELDPASRDILRAELAYIANCGVVALDADPARPEQVERAARESLGLVNLGLGLLSKGDAATAGQVMARLGLASVARQGAGVLRELNTRAWVLLREGWLSKISTGLRILDAPLDRWLAGLTFIRPRCYDHSLGFDREYRAFASVSDVEAARLRLTQAELWGRILFEYMDLTPETINALLAQAVWPADKEDIHLSHVMGTWLARQALGLKGLSPIEAASLPQAVAALQKGLSGPLAQELTASLQALPQAQDAAGAGVLLRAALNRLRQELGGLSIQAELNPEFVGGLVFK